MAEKNGKRRKAAGVRAQYLLKMDDKMRDGIKKLAAHNLRSMNDEICIAIREYMEEHKEVCSRL